MEFEGEFETHITINIDSASNLEAMKIWADFRNLKFHHIVLDSGLTPSQPMVSRRGYGTFSRESVIAKGLTQQLNEAGFSVSRIKLEAALANQNIPESDADAVLQHRGRYFEHHVKLTLEPNTDVTDLTDLARNHSAHLSRNVRRIRDDGRMERFVTQRCYCVGRTTANLQLQNLVQSLVKNGYTILHIEEEFVVSDSNPCIDAGWIEEGRVS